MKKVLIFLTAFCLFVNFADGQVKKSYKKLRADDESFDDARHTSKYKKRRLSIRALETPLPTGVASIDALVDSADHARALSKMSNDMLGFAYEKSVDTAVGHHFNELIGEAIVSLTQTIATIRSNIAISTNAVAALEADSNYSLLLKQPNVMRSIAYIKTMNELLTEELVHQQKFYNTLLSTYQSNFK